MNLQRESALETSTVRNDYVLGDHDRELERLMHQALVFEAPTRLLLESSGLNCGMRCLDLGCGVGDVSLLAAELVGPHGRVDAVDRSSRALSIAAARAHERRFEQIHFECADVYTPRAFRYDVVVSRFLLLHFKDPGEIVDIAARATKPFGTVAFAEMDIRSAGSVPPLRFLQQCLGYIVQLYEALGLNPDTGSALYNILASRGLKPQMQASCSIEPAHASTALNFVVETLRTMAPQLEALGIVSEQELDLPNLKARLTTEASESHSCLIFPRFVTASARIDASPR